LNNTSGKHCSPSPKGLGLGRIRNGSSAGIPHIDGDFRLLFRAIRTRLQSRLFLFVARKIVSWDFLNGDLKPDSRERLRGWHTSSPEFIMKLYVGNLSFDTTENDLKALFAEFGTVTDTYLVTDRATGDSRGFAFVTMSNANEGKAAIKGLAEKEFAGRTLTVNEARPKEDRPKRSFAGSRR
jgi:cold-inducible RNA-binding protein